MAKPGQKPKTQRNQAIRNTRLAQPDLSLKEIGDMFGGIKKQRVWQIVHEKKLNV